MCTCTVLYWRIVCVLPLQNRLMPTLKGTFSWESEETIGVIDLIKIRKRAYVGLETNCFLGFSFNFLFSSGVVQKVSQRWSDCISNPPREVGNLLRVASTLWVILQRVAIIFWHPVINLSESCLRPLLETCVINLPNSNLLQNSKDFKSVLNNQ
jgi:hypothetical protein